VPPLIFSRNKVQTRGHAAAADLAYAYGEYQLIFPVGKTEKGFYLHIWKREGKGWRIVLDLQQLLPEAPKAKTEKTVSGEKNVDKFWGCIKKR